MKCSLCTALLPILTALSDCAGDRPISPDQRVIMQPDQQLVRATTDIRQPAVMKEALRRAIPTGTSLANARRFMEQEGFACKITRNGSFRGREGIDYLYCDRSERYAHWVDQRWQIALVLEGDRVRDIEVAHGLIGP